MPLAQPSIADMDDESPRKNDSSQRPPSDSSAEEFSKMAEDRQPGFLERILGIPSPKQEMVAHPDPDHPFPSHRSGNHQPNSARTLRVSVFLKHLPQTAWQQFSESRLSTTTRQRSS